MNISTTRRSGLGNALRILFPASLALSLLVGLSACEPKAEIETKSTDAPPVHYDLIIQNGVLYDGSGSPGYRGDLAVNGDRVAALGDLGGATAERMVDAAGMAVTPGFINVFSWASASLPDDGRAVSDIKQGVTLEIFGEGHSLGPYSPESKVVYGMTDMPWNTLGGAMQWLEEKGIAPNVAAFVGAGTVRVHQLGWSDVQPDAAQIQEMQKLVAQAMEEGALGVSSSLIYTPDAFAKTEELIALAKIAGKYGGIYTSHIRNEADGVFEAIDELITIAREGDLAAEIYHFKLSSKAVQDRFDEVVAKIESARAEGLSITADMYPYIAGATGIDALMPPWATEGGLEGALKRFEDPETRRRLRLEMETPSTEWQNLYAAIGPEKVVFTEFASPAMQKYIGRTLAEVASERGEHPADTAINLVREDQGRPMALFYLQTEEIVERSMALPWMSFCSDAQALTIDETVAQSPNTHPRAYGSFSRVLGYYVREREALSFEEGVRRLTSHPAETFNIRQRGRLRAGYFADIAIFDPAKIQDHATFKAPHQYSTGMTHLFVNGDQVLKDGEPTGALPGRFVRGPGWKGDI